MEEEVIKEENVMSQQETPMRDDLKSLIFSKSLFSLILGASFIFIVVFSGYYFLNEQVKKQTNTPKKQSLLKSNNVVKKDTSTPSNWKVYKDESFKYTLMLPNEWNTYKRVSDGTDYQIGIYPSDKPGAPITISSQLNEQNVSAEDFVKNQYGESYPIEKRKIGENDAIFVRNDSAQYVSYFINKNNRMYELAASSENQDTLKIFDQILSTFQIAESK